MNNEFELPDEIWKYILDFTLDWKRSHKQKMKSVLESPYLLKCYRENIKDGLIFHHGIIQMILLETNIYINLFYFNIDLNLIYL